MQLNLFKNVKNAVNFVDGTIFFNMSIFEEIDIPGTLQKALELKAVLISYGFKYHIDYIWYFNGSRQKITYKTNNCLVILALDEITKC